MARFFRLSLALAAAGILASSAVANVPDATLSSIPDKITIWPAFEAYPGGAGWNEMTIIGTLGTPVIGALVEIEFIDPGLLCWCLGQTQPVLSANTDGLGVVSFNIEGGGCDEPARNLSTNLNVVIKADTIVMGRAIVNSPDVVDDAGAMATDGWAPGGTCIVKGNDAVWHTPAIVNNLVEPCSKFDQTTAVTDIVNSTDAVILTPFVIANSSCIQAP